MPNPAITAAADAVVQPLIASSIEAEMGITFEPQPKDPKSDVKDPPTGPAQTTPKPDAETAAGDTVAGDAGDAGTDTVVSADGDDAAGAGEEAGDADTVVGDAGDDAVGDGAGDAATDAGDAAALTDQQVAGDLRQGPGDPAAAQAAHAQWLADMAELEAMEKKLARAATEADSFDPIEDTPKAMQSLIREVKALRQSVAGYEQEKAAVVQERQAAARADQYWQDWGKKNADVPAPRAKDIFQEELAASLKKYPTSIEAARAVATERFEARVAKIRAAKKEPAAPSPKPKPKADTQIAPGSTARPPKAPQTVDEKLEAGAYGNLSHLV